MIRYGRQGVGSVSLAKSKLESKNRKSEFNDFLLIERAYPWNMPLAMILQNSFGCMNRI